MKIYEEDLITRVFNYTEGKPEGGNVAMVRSICDISSPPRPSQSDILGNDPKRWLINANNVNSTDVLVLSRPLDSSSHNNGLERKAKKQDKDENPLISRPSHPQKNKAHPASQSEDSNDMAINLNR